MSTTRSPNAGPSLLARRKSLFWRIHFWAALIASPFTLAATLTGMLYIFTPQIESVLYHQLDHVPAAGRMLPLDASVAAARAVAPPGLALQSVFPPFAATDSVRVLFAPATDAGGEHAGHTGMAMPMPLMAPAQPLVVYINPYTAGVLGSMASAERFGQWAKKLHSQLLQGEGWRWMIELAASWLMVMLISGIYLWWPRGGSAAVPRAGARGRPFWSQWHAFLGVVLSLMSLIILTTGLTWSKQAGGQIRALRDATGQASPQVPAALASAAPAATGTAMLDWQAAWQVTRPQAPAVALMLTPPAGPLGVWRAGSAGRGLPGSGFDLVFDAYRGTPLYYSGWPQQTAFGKATAIGIPFHRGEFGWWNQALLLVFGAGLLFSLLSGWVMYFKRRRPGTSGLPRLLPGAWRATPPAAWLGAALLCALMPLLALSAAVVMVLELVLYRRAIVAVNSGMDH